MLAATAGAQPEDPPAPAPIQDYEDEQERELLEDEEREVLTTSGAASILFLPLAGPFIALATHETTVADSAMLVIDGIGQVGGLAMFIAGLASEQPYVRRVHEGGVTVTPLVGTGHAGAMVHGTF